MHRWALLVGLFPAALPAAAADTVVLAIDMSKPIFNAVPGA